MTAPRARTVDQFSGRRAPTKFFAALSEADAFCRELDEFDELRTRVQELGAENRELKDENLELRMQLERARHGRRGW